MTVAAAMLLTSPSVARAQDADRDHPAAKAQDTADKSDNKVEDAWILTKVKSKFIGEDALKDSNINVDVLQGVVVLKGTVASEAGRARAIAIAKDTDGVVRIEDKLTVSVATKRQTGADRTTAAKVDEAADDTKHAAKDAAHDTKHAAKKGSEATKDAAGTAGEVVTDSWITTKVKSSFVGVDALDGSNIDVDTTEHVVTLTGTVPSELARTEAVRIAKQVQGVTKVSDKLTIAPKK
jgi:osmotically-inducible protein OsmY